MNEIVLIVLAYVVASIPFGLIIGKAWGSIDVRKVGSGNIGTSNVMRSVGKGAAAVVLILDVLKGTIPVWWAQSIGVSGWAVAAVVVAVVLGHVWSVFLRFNGGKGIATGLGSILGLDPGVALSLIVVWGGVLIFSRYISLASIVATIWLPIALWLFTDSVPNIVAGILLCVIVVWRHRDNIKRLRLGTEYRFGERVQKAERR